MNDAIFRCRFDTNDTHSGVVLEKVCEYLYYYERYRDVKSPPDMEIPTELALELMLAADFLNGTTAQRVIVD